MLILTRKPGESIYIGDGIKVVIVEVKGNQIRVGIEAPSDVRIYREEIYVQILEENKKAAEASSVSDAGLEGLAGALNNLPPVSRTKGSAQSLLSSGMVKRNKSGKTSDE